jgi:hypothetical protein
MSAPPTRRSGRAADSNWNLPGGCDRIMPWWQFLILVSVAYFANDIALLLARLVLGPQRLQRLAAKFQTPPLENY